MFRELAYDYENNCLKRKGGKTYLVEKDEAVRVWIYKALLTRRFVWPAYTHAYGSELEAVIGYSNNRDILDSEVKRYITETLMVKMCIRDRYEGIRVQPGDYVLVQRVGNQFLICGKVAAL